MAPTLEQSFTIEDLDLERMITKSEETKVIASKTGTEILMAEGYPYELSLRRVDIEDEKMLKRFIHNVEKTIRCSPEYRSWVEYLKDVLGHFSCAVTGEVDSQVSIHIHHHPVSLYTIVKAMIMKKIEADKEFCSFDIATEVIELHYQSRIGYIPLLGSMHEKFHNNFLSLPMEFVHGDWKYLMDNFVFDEDDLDIINPRLGINKDNCGWGSGYLWNKQKYYVEEKE